MYLLIEQASSIVILFLQKLYLLHFCLFLKCSEIAKCEIFATAQNCITQMSHLRRACKRTY